MTIGNSQNLQQDGDVASIQCSLSPYSFRPQVSAVSPECTNLEGTPNNNSGFGFCGQGVLSAGSGSSGTAGQSFGDISYSGGMARGKMVGAGATGIDRVSAAIRGPAGNEDGAAGSIIPSGSISSANKLDLHTFAGQPADGQVQMETKSERQRKRHREEAVNLVSALSDRWRRATDRPEAVTSSEKPPDVRWIHFSGFDYENGGLYIGYGDETRQLQRSWFADGVREPGLRDQERELLLGRPLMIASEADKALALQLWRDFDLGSSPKKRLSLDEWQKTLKRSLKDMARISSVDFGVLGALCRVALEERPGSLSLSVGFQRFSLSGVASEEILPIPLEPLAQMGLPRDQADWVYCWSAILNWMFLGGRRHLFEPMKLASTLNESQIKAVRAMAEVAKALCQAPPLDLSSDVRECGGVRLSEYGPQVVNTALKVTLEQVRPSLPPKDAAARVAIEDLVGAQTRAWLADPSLMLLPCDELPEVIPCAKVLVDSQTSYEELVKECFALGIMEGSGIIP